MSDRIQELRSKAQGFLEDQVMGLEPLLYTGQFEALAEAIADKRKAVQRLGLWGPTLPEDFGGLGLSVLEFGLLSEVLGRSPLGHLCFNCQAPDAGNMEILHSFGTEAQQQTFLKPLAAGELRSCFAMTEPGRAGSNPTWLETTAVKDGEDYVLNGHKWFCSSFDGARFMIVMAVTNPEAESRHMRASQIIVPTDTEGVECVRNISVMGEAGEGYFSHSELRLRQVRVPQSNLLGGEGQGFRIAQERLGPGRIHHCMRWLGICERSFDLMRERARSRELSPGKVLGEKQMVQQWLAECRAEINAARLLVLEAAWSIDKQGSAAARDKISLIKFFVADVLQKVLDRAIQVHGALGMTDDTPIAWWYRHERAARIYDGADEVHKASVAKRMMRG